MGPEKRRKVPDRIALRVALRQLGALLAEKHGMEGVQVKLELDHDPALGRRLHDETTGHHIPHQHEETCLIYRVKADHDRKTNGRPSTTLGSDKHEIAKTNRLTEEQEEFRRRLTAREAGEPKPPSKWGKRPMQSRNTFKDRRR